MLAGRLAGMMLPWGVDTHAVPTAAQAISLLRALPDSAMHTLILHKEGLTGDVHALASALQGLDQSGRLPLILVEDGTSGDLPVDLQIRRISRRWYRRRPKRRNGVRRSVSLGRIAAPCRRRDPVPAIAPAAGQGRKLHILVADDNRTNQRVVGKILERAGFTTKIVGNGEEALNALDDARFDLVLMDVNMPVMNGLEATKLYRFTSLANPICRLSR